MGIEKQPASPFWRTVKALMACSTIGLLCLLAVPAMAVASPETSADNVLEQRVLAFLEERTQHFGDDVSISLRQGSARLPECQQPEPFLPNFGQQLHGRVSIGVRCGEQGRVRYLQADVSVMTEHVVLARDIAANSRITADDLKWEEALLERLPRHALLAFDEAVGLLAVRPLPAGTTLQAHHLRREALVKRGDSVTVFARGAGFSVSREAEALDNGALGDEVRLRTDDGDRLQARVVGRNQLEIVF